MHPVPLFARWSPDRLFFVFPQGPVPASGIPARAHQQHLPTTACTTSHSVASS
jgi:hypothetical protein